MKFKNLRRPNATSKKRRLDFDIPMVQNQEIDSMMEDEERKYDDDVTEIQLEAEREYPRKKLLKKLLLETLEKRRQWIRNECPTVEKVLNEFPILKVKRWVHL
jgi:hypothetical protein